MARTITYVKPQVTALASAIRVVESSNLKWILVVVDCLWVVFATSSAYETDE